MNDTLDQMDLIDIYKTFDPKATIYTFFSNPYGSFSKTDHMVGCKTSLNKFKKIEIISNIFSDQRLETRNQPQGKISKTFTFMENE